MTLSTTINRRASGDAGLISFGLGRTQGSGGTPTPTPAPGTVLYTIPNAMDVRIEPTFTTNTVDGSNRITLVPDMLGLADMTPITTGTTPPGGAPKLVTDSLGRKCLLFEGTQAAQLADTLASYTGNTCTVIAIVRYLNPNGSAAQSIFSLGRNVNSPPNTLRAFMNSLGNTASNGVAANSFPPMPCMGGKYIVNGTTVTGTEKTAGTSIGKMICHTGLQVVAVSGAASNAAHIHMNDEYVSGMTTINTGTTSVNGAEVGRYSQAPNTSTNYGSFYLYGLFVKRATMTPAQVQANIAAIMTAYALDPISNQLVIEGDSRFSDFGLTSTGLSPSLNFGTFFTEPGKAYCLPTSWRVVQLARGGSKILADTGATGVDIDKGLTQRRDYANNSFFTSRWKLSGRNVVALETYYNDVGDLNSGYVSAVGTSARGDEIYARLQALVDTDATSYLAKGMEYLASITLPGSSTYSAAQAQLRSRFRSSNFFADFRAGSGGVNEGKVRRAEVPLSMPISGAWGSQVLDTALGAGDARIGTYFYDQQHELPACYPYMAQCIHDAVLAAPA